MSTNTAISPPLRKRPAPLEETEKELKTLKIMTWNVAALRTIPSKLGTTEFQNKVSMNNVLAAFFKKYQVDIACFQEHKFSGWDKLDKEYACIDGYDSFWSFSGSGYAGVVTYARTGLTKSFTDNPFAKDPSSKDVDPLSKGRCMLTDHGGFLILNIYAPNAGRGPEYLEKKMTFYDELSQAIARWTQDGRKVVVTGDINTAHEPLDIYNPRKYLEETGFLEIERDWITTFLSERKCKDVWREFNPNVRKYTFWDQKRLMREKNCGWRIDIFYANEGMMSDVISSDIHNDIMGSDHCPISMTIKDALIETFPTPSGAGNIRKATKQQTLTSFFKPGSKRESSSSPDAPVSKVRVITDAPDIHGKVIKQDMTRRKLYGEESSQESNYSDRDEILQELFGVRRGKVETVPSKIETETTDEDAAFLANHRKKEAEWRKHLG